MSELDNLEPFRHPDCTCEWWSDDKGVTISMTCPLHGIGTEYGDRQTEEIRRMAEEARRRTGKENP